MLKISVGSNWDIVYEENCGLWLGNLHNTYIIELKVSNKQLSGISEQILLDLSSVSPKLLFCLHFILIKI